MFLSALVQMNATSDEAATMEQAEHLVARAASYGATLIATPENTNFLGPHDIKVARAQALDGPTCQRFAGWAKQHAVHLLIGGFNETSDEPKRCYNTSLLYGPDGALLGAYRKMHLFDVDHSDAVRFFESRTCKPGDTPVVVHTALGTVGLSICYDLRFPRLYQALVEQGADILAVPSAFTLTTGKDHWEPLLRARAIETQCYVLAPAQYGHHDDGGLRQSWGHSMIVDPWGAVIGQASEGSGLVFAEVDLERVRRTRRGMPVSAHRRLG